jgi:hypothetical protein
MLSSCTLFNTDTVDDYLKIYEDIEIDLLKFTYHETHPYQLYDKVLMVDLTSNLVAKTHFIASSNDTNLQRDEKMLIDDQYIYMTNQMIKTPHMFVDINVNDYLEIICNTYDFIKLEYFNKSYINQFIEIGYGFTKQINRDVYTLKWYIPNEDENLERVNTSIQISFNQKALLEFHYRFEYEYESTKQQNNYIYGFHVYYIVFEEITFPTLDLFNLE